MSDQSRRDAMADAETLRLALKHAADAMQNAARRLQGSGRPHTNDLDWARDILARGEDAARAAFRAVPGLKED